jgi:hypothetical protein
MADSLQTHHEGNATTSPMAPEHIDLVLTKNWRAPTEIDLIATEAWMELNSLNSLIRSTRGGGRSTPYCLRLLGHGTTAIYEASRPGGLLATSLLHEMGYGPTLALMAAFGFNFRVCSRVVKYFAIDVRSEFDFFLEAIEDPNERATTARNKTISPLGNTFTLPLETKLDNLLDTYSEKHFVVTLRYREADLTRGSAVLLPTQPTRQAKQQAEAIPQQVEESHSSRAETPAVENGIEMFGLSFDAPTPISVFAVQISSSDGRGAAIQARTSPEADSPWTEDPPPPYALSPSGFISY